MELSYISRSNFPTAFLLLFYQELRFCVVVPRVLQIWEIFFYLQAFFALYSFPHLPKYRKYYGSERTFFILKRFLTYILSQHLAQPAFIMASLGAGTSSMKVAGPPTEVRNTDPAHIFVWTTYCSAKSITW